MKKFALRIAVVIGAAAVSAGLVGATAAPATADAGRGVVTLRDTSWPGS
jgi:hypothetical protein